MTWQEFSDNISNAFNDGYNPITDSFDVIKGWFTSPGDVAITTTQSAEKATADIIGNVLSGVYTMIRPLVIPVILVGGGYLIFLWLTRGKK